jgi:hypothetical protein
MDAGAAMVLGGAVVLAVLPSVAMITGYMMRRLESKERIKAIEHGHLLPFDPKEVALRTRRSGTVCVAAGLGVIAAVLVAAWTLHDTDLLAAIGMGLVPLFIGCGLLADYRTQSKDLR